MKEKMRSVHRNHFYLLPLFLLLCIPPRFMNPFSKQFVKGDANLIQQMCSQTVAPMLCTTCLVPDPRSNTADLVGLIKIIFDCGCNQVQVMAGYVKNQTLSADNHQRAVLENCYLQLFEAAYHFEKGSSFLNENNFVDARRELRAAPRPIFVCLDKFRQYPPVTVPSDLMPGVLEFEGFGQIINRLIGVLHRSTKPPMASVRA